MSKFRAEMREALKNLDTSTPLRIPAKLAFKTPILVNAPEASGDSRSSPSEETGLNIDRVQNSQGQKWTGSNSDPLIPQTEKVENESEQLADTLSKLDPVKLEQVGTGFTQVPHSLLRISGLFEDPIDFMVYLHLFTFSWGFQRETVDMGLTQLERFTGAARNTVRKSLLRLIQRRWITEVQKQEAGQISRKWKVRNPSPKDTEPTGSKLNRGRNGPGQDVTPRGSDSAPVTGSKLDPYKESSKQSFKETLSLQAKELRDYFTSINLRRKREDEWRACQEILKTTDEARVVKALQHVLLHGVGEKREACHSPMAYLAKAIDSVLARVDDQARVSAELEAALDAKIRKQKEDREAKEREDREIAEKIAAFERAHPDEHKRLEEIERLTHGSLLKSPNAKVVIAAQRWCHQ